MKFSFTEFETEEMRSVFSNILSRLEQESDSDKEIPKPADVSTNGSMAIDPIKNKKSQKVNQKDFINNTLSRMQAMENKRKEKIKKNSDLLKAKEMSSLKSLPVINKRSKKMINTDLNIAERSEKQIKNFNKKIEEQKKKSEDDRAVKMMDGVTFKPEINEKNIQIRTSEEYFDYNLKWIQRISEKNKDLKSKLEEKEVSEVQPIPKINKNSSLIIEQLGIRKDVSERLFERFEIIKENIERKVKERTHSFTPVILEKSKKMGKKDGNVFQRLSISVERLENNSPRFGLGSNN